MLMVAPPLFRTRVASLTYIGRGTHTGVLASSITASFDFGAASPNRHVLVISSYWSASTSGPGCTILGVAAALIKSNYTSNSKSAAFLATVPSGGVGNVVVNGPSSGGGWSVDCWRIDKVTVPAMVDSEAVSTLAQNYTNSGIVVPADGGLVAAVRHGYFGGARTFTWTGLTENSDAMMATNYGATAASQRFVGGQNPVNIGVNCSGTMSTGAGFIAVCLQ